MPHQKLLQRLTALVALATACPLALAQQGAADANVKLAVTNFGVPDLPSLYYAEWDAATEKFRPRPLLPGHYKRAPQIEIAPQAPRKLFVEAGTTTTGEPNLEEFLDLQVEDGGSYLVLLDQSPTQGVRSRFLDDSAAAHPPGSVRLVNLTNQQMAVAAGGKAVRLAPGREGMLVPEVGADGRFSLQYSYVNREGETIDTPRKNLTIYNPRTRVLVVFAEVPREIETGQLLPDGEPATRTVYDIEDYRLYDAAPE